jgi:hypothetical protein
MEALLSSGGPQSDILVGPLKFGLDPQGSYVQQRRNSTTFSNVTSASPAGVKTITINCGSSSEWLDPSTVLLSFLITNTDATNALWAATAESSCLFDRMQVRLGSTLIEDIQDYGKLAHIMTKLSMSPQKKMDAAQLGFGTQAASVNGSYFLAGQHDAQTIAASSSKRVYMKFDLSGLFSQQKWIPLFALGGQGLQIQLSLAPANQAMIISHGGTTYSQGYTLSDIRLLADMCSLSGELQESYNAALLNGTSLKMPIKSWEVLTNYLPADSSGSFDVAISKSYTRLATLFAVFNQNPPADNSGKAKLVNTNYFPTAQSEDVLYHLAMGSRRVPDNDVRGSTEAWWRLGGALGLGNSLAHSTSVDAASYKSDCFAIGIDVEKLPMVSASGENLSTGQTIFLKVKGMGTDANAVPQQCRICAHFEKVISIQDTVVDVFE